MLSLSLPLLLSRSILTSPAESKGSTIVTSTLSPVRGQSEEEGVGAPPLPRRVPTTHTRCEAMAMGASRTVQTKQAAGPRQEASVRTGPKARRDWDDGTAIERKRRAHGRPATHRTRQKRAAATPWNSWMASFAGVPSQPWPLPRQRLGVCVCG